MHKSRKSKRRTHCPALSHQVLGTWLSEDLQLCVDSQLAVDAQLTCDVQSIPSAAAGRSCKESTTSISHLRSARGCGTPWTP